MQKYAAICYDVSTTGDVILINDFSGPMDN